VGFVLFDRFELLWDKFGSNKLISRTPCGHQCSQNCMQEPKP